jgi:hypothetical protein
LLVIDVSGNTAAWAGFNDMGASGWMKIFERDPPAPFGHYSFPEVSFMLRVIALKRAQADACFQLAELNGIDTLGTAGLRLSSKIDKFCCVLISTT